MLNQRLKPKAIALLKRVKRTILKEPKRIDMGTWLVRRDKVGGDWEPEKGWSKCNTVGCIAGWTCVLGAKRVRKLDIGGQAMRLLGLDHDLARELFMSDDLVHDGDSQTLAHAQAVAKHIDEFIERYS